MFQYLADVVPPTLPSGYDAANGATRVVIQAIEPGAVTTGEVALLVVCLFGFSFTIVLLLFLLLRRAI
jgi:hypothetical protein